MWTYLFLFLFLGTLIALAVVLGAFTRKVAEVEKQKADLQIEENRVFDFLHGLGEAFSEGVRSAELHRLIVEGAIRILEAQGGVLYLVDKTRSALVPAFVSSGCPPLLPLPARVIAETGSAAESFFKLHSVKPGDGPIGRAWGENHFGVIGRESLAFEDGRPPSLEAHSCILGPLQYRRKIIGVLAVANGPESTPFLRDEIGLFKTIAEQSAFALYNEAIYREAGEKKRFDQDLQTAREIQGILLPSTPPRIEGYDISGRNIPAGQVSGDYFDFIFMGDGRIGVVIADVSGKGVPASLIMAMCRSVLRSQALSSNSPAEVLRRVNRLLYPDIKEDMFISMVFAIVEPNNPEILIARAGHDAPLCFRSATGEVETINVRGMALGIDSGDVFDRVCEDLVLRLDQDDMLVLYTDGVTEALNENGDEFGIPGLVQGIAGKSSGNAIDMVEGLSADVMEFIGKQLKYDDVTLVAVKKI